ncbi:MAG: hypothetical protein WCT22_03650, partial [Patescibacteria group bacterium]
MSFESKIYNANATKSILLALGVFGVPACALIIGGYFAYQSFINKISRQPDLTQPNILLSTPTPSVTPTPTMEMLPVECVNFSNSHRLITIIVNGQVT